jgi:hypothetical protein
MTNATEQEAKQAACKCAKECANQPTSTTPLSPAIGKFFSPSQAIHNRFFFGFANTSEQKIEIYGAEDNSK